MSDDTNVLKNGFAVVKYLKAQGYDVSRGTVYNHINNGLLKPTGPKGGWLVRAVENYAKANWTKVGDSTAKPAPRQATLVSGANGGDTPAEERTRADAALKQRQAELAQLRLEQQRGNLIPRDTVERELALRGQAFRFGLENEIHKAAPEIAELFGADFRVAAEIVRLVGGDEARAGELVAWAHKRVPELVHFWQRRMEEFLAPYASGEWWTEEMAEAMKPKETQDAGSSPDGE